MLQPTNNGNDGTYAFVGPGVPPGYLSPWSATSSEQATGTPGHLTGLLTRNNRSQYYPKSPLGTRRWTFSFRGSLSGPPCRGPTAATSRAMPLHLPASPPRWACRHRSRATTRTRCLRLHPDRADEAQLQPAARSTVLPEPAEPLHVAGLRGRAEPARDGDAVRAGGHQPDHQSEEAPWPLRHRHAGQHSQHCAGRRGEHLAPRLESERGPRGTPDRRSLPGLVSGPRRRGGPWSGGVDPQPGGRPGERNGRVAAARQDPDG